MNNIILTGMPGAGKSTIGVLLAKVLGYGFADADLLIQEQYGKLLCELIAEHGDEGFLQIENQVNRDIALTHTVIATGGSAVYCREAMEKYRANDTIVYIKLPYEEIEARLGNIKRRGVVLKEGQTLKSLYDERIPLYEKYAHIIVNAEGLGIEELMDSIAGLLMIHEKY
ncbi:MAG: shikimate kinase [Coprococcus sp.]